MASYPAGPRPWDSAGAGGGIRTPDRLITNQLLYRTELRQPDKDASLARLVPRRQPAQAPRDHPIRRRLATQAEQPELLIILYSGRPTPCPPLRVLHALHDYLPRHQAGSEIYVAHLCAAQRRAGRAADGRGRRVRSGARPRPAHLAVARRRAGGRGGQHLAVRQTSTAPIATRRWRPPSGTCSTSSSRTSCTCTTCSTCPSSCPRWRARAASASPPRCTTTRWSAPRGASASIATSRTCATSSTRRGARAVSRPRRFTRSCATASSRAARRRARWAGWPRRCGSVAPRATDGGRRGVRAHRGRAIDADAIERRLAAARVAFANFDVAVAPSASLAREYAALGFPTEHGGRLRLRVRPAGQTARGRPTRMAACGSALWARWSGTRAPMC